MLKLLNLILWRAMTLYYSPFSSSLKINNSILSNNNYFFILLENTDNEHCSMLNGTGFDMCRCDKSVPVLQFDLETIGI